MQPTAAFHTAVDRPALQAARHPHTAERELVWIRHASIAFWGLALVRMGHPVALDATWIVYGCIVAYSLALHWRVHGGRHARGTALLATITDSLVTFAICWVSGGIESVFVPFFYITVLSGALRYGVREAVGMFLLNGSLVTALLWPWTLQPRHVDAWFLHVAYVGVATVLGAMFAGWARANLALALEQSRAVRHERDVSTGLLHRLIHAREAERQQTANDLHDRMGGRLFALTHGIDAAIALALGNAALERELRGLGAIAAACGRDVRGVMNSLRPTVLDELGLLEALAEFLADHAKQVDFVFDVRLDPALREWHSREDAMLFRLVQEALLNVRKHARAQHVRVTFMTVDDGVQLCVVDDGVGFDPAAVPVGRLGMLTMREHAELCGGQLHLRSAPGEGTRIQLHFPRTA